MGRQQVIIAQEIRSGGAGGLADVIAKQVKLVTSGDAVARERAAVAIFGLATQMHGEHCTVLAQAGCIVPLVKLLADATSSAKAQAAAAGALQALGGSKQEHQQAIVDASGVPALVKLLKQGSPKVQEAVASALASLDSNITHQKQIIELGCIVALMPQLTGTSGAAQAHAAQCVANMASYDEATQIAISKAGGVPPLVTLLKVSAQP